ncbi:MAG: class I SAM-dependent methyltransferase, partial [Acidimicrobiales bacterium]
MGPDEIRRQAELEDRHFWYRARRQRVAALVPRSTPGGRALDVGCGSGGTTRVLADAGYRVSAVEYQPNAVRHAFARGLRVARSDAEHLPFAATTFDVVLATDVLEHLPDDAGAVSEIARVLVPGGSLVLNVPADPRLWSEHDIALGHVRRYGRDRLRSLLDRCGLVVDRVDAWMVLARPAVRLFRGRRRPTLGYPAAEDDLAAVLDAQIDCLPSSDLVPVSWPVNALLTSVMAVERHLPWTSRLNGVSLLAVAHRPAPATTCAAPGPGAAALAHNR